MRIAIQGEKGSFHEAATARWFDEFSIVPSDDFRGVFEAVAKNRADALVVAIENSLYGSINQVYDLVEASGYPIIGEIKLRVAQQLIGLPGTTPSDITKIYSHPVALAQCADYLDQHFPDAERIEHHDTAESVAYIKQLGEKNCVAIAGKQAAELYDMPILATDIEDNQQNYTRFLVMQPDAPAPKDANRSSLSLVTSHQAGALSSVLNQFAEAGVNLVKLQSRPIVGQPWNYKFYLVVESAGPELFDIVSTIRAAGNQVTILGQYRADNS